MFIFLRDQPLFIEGFMQNTQVLETMEFRRPCGLEYQSKHPFTDVTTTVSCYRGAVVPPKWKDIDTRKYLI